MARITKKPYTKSKRFDKSRRNHGGCPYCENNRTHNARKRLTIVREMESEPLGEDSTILAEG